MFALGSPKARSRELEVQASGSNHLNENKVHPMHFEWLRVFLSIKKKKKIKKMGYHYEFTFIQNITYKTSLVPVQRKRNIQNIHLNHILIRFDSIVPVHRNRAQPITLNARENSKLPILVIDPRSIKNPKTNQHSTLNPGQIYPHVSPIRTRNVTVIRHQVIR
ncbi:hypothetical protein MIMGU_mgv1a015285mg [Erythranthe guttata]|uniref:Uncharacterized protein n=1 Tax=Erythranthe guttata TaxID=4155 RepID=A0A022R2G0_ERYGU|nr:hypothetical protein MIMGU_mgv1a015285mg [Erythranthe guttata]